MVTPPLLLDGDANDIHIVSAHGAIFLSYLNFSALPQPGAGVIELFLPHVVKAAYMVTPGYSPWAAR